MDSDDEFDLETSRPLSRVRLSQSVSQASNTSRRSLPLQSSVKKTTRKDPLQFIRKNTSQFKVPSQTSNKKNDKNATNNNKKVTGSTSQSAGVNNNVGSNIRGIQSQPTVLQKSEHKNVKRKSSDGSMSLEQVKKSRSEEGNCPFCQMPWCDYISSGRKKDFHNFTCLDKNLDELPECPELLNCNFTDEKHFWSYQHSKLAIAREEQERALNSSMSQRLEDLEKSTGQRSQREKLGCDNHTFAGPSGWRPEDSKPQDSNKSSIVVEYDSDDSQQSAIAQLLEDVDYIRNNSNKGIVIRDDSQTEVNKRDAAGSVDRQFSGLKDHDNNSKNHGKILIENHITVIADSDDNVSFENDDSDDKTVCSEVTKIFEENVRTVRIVNRQVEPNPEDVDFFSVETHKVNNINRNRVNRYSSDSQKSISLLPPQQNGVEEEIRENGDFYDEESTSTNSYEESERIVKSKPRPEKLVNRVLVRNTNNLANEIHFNCEEFETSTQVFDDGASQTFTHLSTNGKNKETKTSMPQRANENVRSEGNRNSDRNLRAIESENNADNDVTHFRSKDNDRISEFPTEYNNKVAPLTKENLDKRNQSLIAKNAANKSRNADMESLHETQIFNGNISGLQSTENICDESPDSSTILFDMEDDVATQAFREVNKTMERSELEERMFLNEKNVDGENETNSVSSENNALTIESSHAKSLEEYSGIKISSKENIADTENMTERDEHIEGSFVDDDDDEFKHLIERAMEKYLDKDDDRTGKTPHKTPNKTDPGPSNKKTSPCVHLHFHINNSPSPSPKGQTSILNFFQPKNRNSVKTKLPFDDNQANITSTTSECSSSSEPIASSRGINRTRVGVTSAANSWAPLMQKMKKLPSVTQSDEASDVSQWNNKTVAYNPQQKQQPWNQQRGQPTGQQRGQSWGQQQGQYQGPRKCPFYKYIPDTGFTVDAFSYGILENVDAYFLSHFHYDHYRGLNKSFSRPIYLSQITYNLVCQRIKVQNKYLNVVPMETPTLICGVEVTFLEANHCPGAVMILFKLRSGTTVLHVGDFRAHSKMESYPALWNCTIDALYLDTTYCNPVYDFPLQEDILEKCVALSKKHVEENNRTLIMIGSYTIGKERVFKAIAEALDCRIWATTDKVRTLKCIEDQDIMSRITDNKYSARVHVVAMKDLQIRKLKDYILTLEPRYNSVLAIKPTGWEYTDGVADSIDNLQPKTCGNVKLYGIPYSEHSSYNELRRFVQFTQPKKIIPTVNNGNPDQRKMMDNCFMQWRAEGKNKQNSISKMWGK